MVIVWVKDERGEGQRHQRHPALRHQHQFPPVEGIRRHAAEDSENKNWQQPHQPDGAERQRVVGERVDLPQDRHRLHLAAG